MHAVYLLINQTTGRIYIGQSADPERRRAAHRNNYRDTLLGRDLAVRPFDFRVRWYPDRATARAYEAAWIDRAWSAGLALYNIKGEQQANQSAVRV